MSGHIDVLAVLREYAQDTGSFRVTKQGATNLAAACATVTELIAASERTVKAFEDLGNARGAAANHFARRECEYAMVAQKEALARVGGAK